MAGPTKPEDDPVPEELPKPKRYPVTLPVTLEELLRMWKDRETPKPKDKGKPLPESEE